MSAVMILEKESGDFTVFEHERGQNRIAIWDGDVLVCWCPDIEQAKKVLSGLTRRKL